MEPDNQREQELESRIKALERELSLYRLGAGGLAWFGSRAILGPRLVASLERWINAVSLQQPFPPKETAEVVVGLARLHLRPWLLSLIFASLLPLAVLTWQTLLLRSQTAQLVVQTSLLRDQTGQVVNQTKLFGQQNALLAEQSGAMQEELVFLRERGAEEDEKTRQLLGATARQLEILDADHDLAVERFSAERQTQDTIRREELLRQIYQPVAEAERSWAEQRLRVEAILAYLAIERAYKRTPTLAYVDLGAARLTDVDFSDVDLHGADLRGAILVGTSLVRANLDRVKLDGSMLFLSDVSGARLIRASLEDVNCDGSTLRDANLYAATAKRASFRGCDLSDANLSGMDLTEADLSGFWSFDRADPPSDPETSRKGILGFDVHLNEIFLSAPRAFGRWPYRRIVVTRGPTKLSNANLDGVNLRAADLRGVEGLKREQLERTVADNLTRIPTTVSRPTHWPAVGASP